MCLFHSTKTLREKKIRKTYECPICLEDICKRTVVCTACEHMMHAKCLRKWKLHCKLHRLDYTCPMCRARF